MEVRKGEGISGYQGWRSEKTGLVDLGLDHKRLFVIWNSTTNEPKTESLFDPDLKGFS